MGLPQIRKSTFLQDAGQISSWYLPISILALSGVLVVLGDDARELLRYDRAAIADSEWWRLISGHFVHLGAQHWLLNAAGLVLVWLLVGHQYDALRWSLVLDIVLVVIGLGFWFLDTNLSWYVGFSGILHGMLIAGALPALRIVPVESTIICLAVTGKLIYEQVAGPLPGSEASAGGAVVVNAHLYGAVGGLLAAALLWRSARPDPTI